MVGWLRRNWIPTLGMVVAVAFVAWLGWINLRGGGSGSASTSTPRASVAVSPQVSPSVPATPTADPAAAQVEAAVKRWVQAYEDAYKTGDVNALSALSVPGSQAYGEAATPANDIRHAGKTFLVSLITFRSISVDATTPTASADVSYSVFGRDVAWPSLQSQGQERTLDEHFRLTFVLTTDGWLVDTVHSL